jgi:hypothetical protein
MNTNTNTDSDFKNDTKPIQYIIDQNIILMKENTTLNCKNLSLENEMTELETDVDQLTKSKNLMQGYLKNFKEINDIENGMIQKYKKMHTKAVEFINILTIFTLTFIGATFNVLDAYTKSSIIALLGVMIFILYRMKLFEDASYKQIKILNDKMEDIKKNIDIIIDFIDNL